MEYAKYNPILPRWHQGVDLDQLLENTYHGGA